MIVRRQYFVVKMAYVVDRTVRYNDSEPRLWYVVRWYVYSQADDTTKPPHHVYRHTINAFRQHFGKKKVKSPIGSCLRCFKAYSTF